MSVCPKSYLYLYDFSAYLHPCPPNRSVPIGAGSAMSRFSASCIRFHLEGHVSQHFEGEIENLASSTSKYTQKLESHVING